MALRIWRGARALTALVAFTGCEPSSGLHPSGVSVDLNFLATLPPGDRAVDSPLLSPTDIEIVEDGILVADDAGPFVRYLDFAGALLATLGRRGQGPGEFRSLAGLAELPGGLIAVSDSRNRRITIFDREGSPRREIRLGPGRVGALAVDRMGRLHLDRRGPVNGKGSFGHPTIMVFSVDGDSLGSYGAYVPSDDPAGDHLLNEARLAASPTGGMWVLYPYQGKVLHYASHSQVTDSILLPPPEGRPADGPFTQPAAHDPNSLVIVRMPVADDIAVDDAGFVFVAVRQTPPDGSIRTDVLVFDPGGARAAVVQLRSVAQRIAIKGDTLYALHSRGDPRIELYKISRSPR